MIDKENSTLHLEFTTLNRNWMEQTILRHWVKNLVMDLFQKRYIGNKKLRKYTVLSTPGEQFSLAAVIFGV